MTEEQLAQVEARVNMATPEPWFWGYGRSEVLGESGILGPDGETVYVNCGRGAGEPTEEDRSFILHARQDVPALLKALRQIHADKADLLCRVSLQSSEQPYKPLDEDTVTDGYAFWSAWCEDCGLKSIEVVRPGKVQCSIGCQYRKEQE